MGVIDKTINNIEYKAIETRLSRFDNFEEEPTIGDLEGLMFYATQFAISVARRTSFNYRR